MSEKKPQSHDSEQLEEVILDIQRTTVDIMNTGTALVLLEKKMHFLQKRRDELRAGQKLFKLGE